MSEIIGLDIGSHSIKLIGFKKTSEGLFLTRIGVKEIPYGKDREEIKSTAETLKALIGEAGLKTKKIRLTVAGSGYHVRRMTMPSIPEKELREAIRWEIKEQLPFPVETARIDFDILGEFVEENVKKLDLMVIACPDQLVEKTLSMVRDAGLEPVHVGVAPVALWNGLLKWDRIKKEETVAAIDLGAEKTKLYLFREGILHFTREMTPAGADITRALMDGEPNLTYEEAEKIKKEVGFSSQSSQEKSAGQPTDLLKMTFLMRPVIERWAAEIGRSLTYYQSQFNIERIDRVILTGGGAHLKNLVSYLESELRIPVEPFNPLGEVLFDPKKIDLSLLNQVGSSFAIATGVALPGPRRVELLPPREPLLSKIQAVKMIPLIAPVIAAILFMLIIWSMSSRVAVLQKERDEKVGRVTKLETLKSTLLLLKERENKMRQEISLFPSLRVFPIPYRRILGEISQIIPENVTLTSLEIQPKSKPIRKASRTSKPQEAESQEDDRAVLYLSGIAFGNDTQCLNALAQIIERLERSSLFKNVKLFSAEENKSYNRSSAEFEVLCDIQSDHPPSLSKIGGNLEGLRKDKP